MKASLKFYYGAMGCGKTRKLQGEYYSKTEDSFETIIIKPMIDTKGDSKTVARDGNELETTFLIKEQDDIYNIISRYLIDNNLDIILVDEAQFLTTQQINQLSDIVDILGINIYCFGLRTDFQTNLFEGSKRLFEIADYIEAIDRKCSCSNNKIFNIRIENNIPVFEGEQIAIDGIEAEYKSVCRNCYKKEKKRIKNKQINK